MTAAIKLMHHSLRILFVFLLFGLDLYAQEIIITGKISDAKTGEPLAYVSVIPKGSKQGVTTNFDGIYKLILSTSVDSIRAGYIGYQKCSKAIGSANKQIIDIQLFPSKTSLREVVIQPGRYVNPAWEILREVIKNKPKNDPRSLTSYQYQSYNRVELDATKFDEKFRNKKLLKSLLPLMDSLKKIAGERANQSYHYLFLKQFLIISINKIRNESVRI